MAEYHDLIQALTWLLIHKLQSQGEYTRGLLGDGQGRTQVPGRPDYSYVRPDRYTTRVFEVFNKEVDGYDGMPVILGELPWQPGLTQVLCVDWDTYEGVGWGDTWPGVKRHGRTHEWKSAAPGYDTFNVYTRQMGDLKTFPLGSGSTSVYVSAYNFDHLGTMKSWPGFPGLSLAAAVPGTTGTARMALVYWDPASGTSGALGVATGTIGVDADPESLNLPVPPAGTIPSAWVRLAGGQGFISEFDIWDARMPWQPGIAFGTGSGRIWAGIIPIADDGGFYTGSTVEHALQELGAGGGGAPSGPAGGDLTGTYPNPNVGAIWGYSLQSGAPASGDVWMFSGTSWQHIPHPDDWKLGNTIVVSTSGQGDYATLAAAFAAASSGDTILVDVEGAIACNDLALPAGVYLRGLGIGLTTLTSTDADQTLTINGGCILRDLTINNTGAGGGHALRIAQNTAYLYHVEANSVSGNAIHTTVNVTDLYFYDCYANAVAGTGLYLTGNGGVEIHGGRYKGATADAYVGDTVDSFIDTYEFPTLYNGLIGGTGYIEGWWFNGFGTRFLMGSNTPAIDMEELASAPATPATSRRRIYVTASGTYSLDQYGATYNLELSGSGSPTGPASGDLTGTYPNPTVDALLGRPLGLDVPAEGYLLTYTGTAWRPMPAGVFPGVATPTGPAGGDLTGTYPNPTVDGLLGRPLALSAPAQGNVLMFTGTAWQPSAMMAPAGVDVTHSVNQSLGTGVTIAFDTETRDDAAFHNTVTNNSRLTVPAGYAGWYVIHGNITYATSALGTYRGVDLQLNGATTIANVRYALVGGAVNRVNLHAIYYLGAGDYIELLTSQDTGGNLSVNASAPALPAFRMVRVGP